MVKVGSRVYHTQAPYKGLGRVVAKNNRAKTVLVKWDIGGCREHAAGVIGLPGQSRALLDQS